MSLMKLFRWMRSTPSRKPRSTSLDTAGRIHECAMYGCFDSPTTRSAPELIILDDLCTDEPLTPEQTERLKAWFVDATVRRILAPKPGHLPFGYVKPHL